MNDPESLTDEDALAIAKEWKEAKQRRVVASRTTPGCGLDDRDFEFDDDEEKMRSICHVNYPVISSWKKRQ